METQVNEIWTLAKSAGPFASMLLLYLYFDERKERRSKDAELKVVLERSIALIHEVKQTMESWLSAFGHEKQR